LRDISFQESLYNGIRDIAEKVLCFSTKVVLIINPKATNLRCFGVYVWKVGGIQYQEIPPNEAEIKNEEVLCSSIKVFLIID